MVYYNNTDTCDKIKEDKNRCGKDFHGKAYKEKNNKGNWTGKWICPECYRKLRSYGTTDDEIINNTRYQTRSRLQYKIGDICPMCIEDNEISDKSILRPKNALAEKDKEGIITGRIVCVAHWHKYYYRNIRKNDPDSYINRDKLLRDSRTGDIDQGSRKYKGDNGEYLICQWKGYINLNTKLDKYNTRIDCLDEKTGEYYQVKIAYYDPIRKRWSYNLKNIQESIRKGYRFKSLYLFCISEYGETVERIYEIPEKDIYDSDTNEGIQSICTIKNPIDCYGNSIVPLYEKYRIIDQEELKNVNEIWIQKLGGN